MAQKDRFYSPSDIDMLRLRMIPIRIDFHSPSGGMRKPCGGGENPPLFFSVSLCLSRACLGKTIGSI